jgi:hypothetical protein
MCSEINALRLIAKFDGIVDLYLASNNYSTERLKQAMKEALSEEALSVIMEKCTDALEGLLADIVVRGDEISRQIEFLSIVIDARFVSWFVSSGKIATPLSRLLALVKQYRRALFTNQQERLKDDGSAIHEMLANRKDPKTEGKLFFHQLK